MRNKKFYVLTAVILLLVFLFSLTLMACEKKQQPSEETPSGDGGGTGPGEGTGPGGEGSGPGEGGDAGDEDDKPPVYAYDVKEALSYIAQAAPSEYASIVMTGIVTANGKEYELSLKTNFSDDDLQVAFKLIDKSDLSVEIGIYVINSKLFVQTADGTVLHIAEADIGYVLAILEKAPDKIKDLLDGALAGLNMTTNDVLNLVVSLLMPYMNGYASEEIDGVVNEYFTIDIELTKLLGSVVGILGGLDLDIDFDLSIISDVIAVLPKYDGQLKVTVSDGVITDCAIKVIDKNEGNSGNTAAELNATVEFNSTGADLGLPEGMENYKELSIGNISADFSLKIDTGSEGLDLGALIDSFLGDKAMFGQGVLVLNAGVDYTLDAKVSLDSNLEGAAVDNNLISLSLKAGGKEFAKLNYVDGAFYVSVEDQIKVAVEFDLAAQINSLVKLVTDAIDNALGTQFKEDVAGVSIASVSLASSDGDVIISSDWQTVINKILGLVGFEQFVTVTGDSVGLKVNQEFIDKIISLAGGGSFTLPFEINALLKLSSEGLDYFEVGLLDNAMVLKADNFTIGTTDLTKDSVLSSVGDKSEYGKDVLGVVNTLLKDFSAEMSLDLSSIDTTVNITNIINNIMVVSDSSLKLPINLDLSNYSGTFKVNFAINQGETSADNRLRLEIITPDGDMLFSAYVYGGKTYVDLSNLGLMKFVLTNADLFEVVRSQLTSGTTSSVATASTTSAEATVSIPQIKLAGSNEIDLDNTSISATVKNELLLALMRSFMFDAGVDVSVEATADLSGKLSAIIDAGFACIGLDITSGKESDKPVNISGLNISEYKEYNALDAELLVDSILETQNLNLMIDFYNNSVDTEYNKPTRILLRRSTAAQGSREYLANGLAAPYRSLVIVMYNDWSNLDDGNAILFGYIDFDNGQVRVKGTDKLFDVWLADGTAIDIPLDIDVKSLLVNALSGLFGDSGSAVDGGIIDVPGEVLPDKDDTTTEEEITEGLSIDSILKGINVKLTASMDVSVDVDFYGALVSDLLDETLQTVFTDMDLSAVTGNTELVTLNYANDTRSVFFNDLYDYIIYPVLEKEVGSFLATLAGLISIDDTMQSIVNRFLPLPSFDTMTANVSLTQGKLNELSLIASNTSGHYGFGAYIFNRSADDVIYWSGQESDVYYNKNCGINPSDLFVAQAKKQSTASSETFYQNVTWSINGVTISDWSVLNTYADGVYTVVGSAFGATKKVTLTIESLAIEKVEDIVVKAMREVPDYITVVFTDGSKRTLYNQTISYTRGAYDSTEAVKAIPASVNLSGTQYDFTIWLENETLAAQEIVVTAFDYKDVFAKLEEDYLKVLVNNSFYRYVEADYDFSQFDSMTKEQLIAGGTYIVPAVIGKGTDIEQTLNVSVRFMPFEVYGIEINGKNYVDADIYDYLAGKAFPETVTVVGFNGESQVRYQAKATWDLSKVTLDNEGGQYIASLTLNEGAYNEWYIPSVGVNIKESNLASLVNDTLEIDTMYALYGGVSIDRLIPDKLDFYTASGQIKTGVPVTIDTSSITVGIKGGTFECPVTVGEGNYLFETTLTIVLKDATLSLVQNEISFTYEEYVESQGAMFAEETEVKLGDAIVSAKVTWFTDDVVFTTPGKYVAYVIIDAGGTYEQRYAVTVNVLASEEV